MRATEKPLDLEAFPQWALGYGKAARSSRYFAVLAFTHYYPILLILLIPYTKYSLIEGM